MTGGGVSGQIRPAMTPQPIDQILALPDKAVVYCFEGQVTKAFKRSDGTNAQGPWSIESFLLKDATGAEIKLMLKDSDPAGWQPGTAVRLEAWKGDKGFSGLYAADDEYKGEVRRILRATKTCTITLLNGGQQHAPQQAAPQQQAQAPQQRPQGQQQPPQQQQPPRQQTTAPAATDEDREARKALNDAKRTILQITNLHLLCAKVVETVEAPAFKKATGHDMTEGQRQGATASVFIESCKKGLVHAMPTTPLEA